MSVGLAQVALQTEMVQPEVKLQFLTLDMNGSNMTSLTVMTNKAHNNKNYSACLGLSAGLANLRTITIL